MTEGIREIVKTLFEAILLVVLVVFIFLQNWRATLIPLIAVPVSLIGTFAVFPLLGFSINTLSLFGLVLAIGIVVDDAIVVVEAVEHHIEEGMSPKEATLRAMEEVSGPVVAIALILTAVFIPVAFIGGITGRLYQQFALTIAISVLISAFNALTLSPALAALLLKPSSGKRTFLTPFYERFNRTFGKVTNGYVSFAGILTRKAAERRLRGRPPGPHLPDGQEPPLELRARGGPGLRPGQRPAARRLLLERTDEVCRKVEAMLKANKDVETYTTVTGYSFLSGAIASNTGALLRPAQGLERAQGRPGARGHHVPAPLQGLLGAGAGGYRLRLRPPAIPGLGTGAGFTMELCRTARGTPRSTSPSRPRSSWTRPARGPSSSRS